MPCLGKFLRHGADKVEHQFAIKTDVVHPQMSNYAFDIFLAGCEARLEVVDDFGDRNGRSPIRKLMAHFSTPPVVFVPQGPENSPAIHRWVNEFKMPPKPRRGERTHRIT